MRATWVVVADGGQAKFFQTRGELTALEAVQTIANTHEWADHRHHVEPDANHHLLEEAFSREICEVIDKVAHQNGFGALILVAEARFLGRLRTNLDPKVLALVTATVDKDLVNVPVHELGQRLAAYVGREPAKTS